jgi:hypothetical protein
MLKSSNTQTSLTVVVSSLMQSLLRFYVVPRALCLVELLERLLAVVFVERLPQAPDCLRVVPGAIRELEQRRVAPSSPSVT